MSENTDNIQKCEICGTYSNDSVTIYNQYYCKNCVDLLYFSANNISYGKCEMCGDFRKEEDLVHYETQENGLSLTVCKDCIKYCENTVMGR